MVNQEEKFEKNKWYKLTFGIRKYLGDGPKDRVSAYSLGHQALKEYNPKISEYYL